MRVFSMHIGDQEGPGIDDDEAVDVNTVLELSQKAGPHPWVDNWSVKTVRLFGPGSAGDLLVWSLGSLVSSRVCECLKLQTLPGEGVRYLPVDVRMRRRVLERYYWLYFEKRFDLVALDHCTFLPESTDHDLRDLRRVVFDATRLLGHNLFEVGLGKYVSESVFEALTFLRLRGVEFDEQVVYDPKTGTMTPSKPKASSSKSTAKRSR